MALLLWKGRTPERIVVVALFALQWGTPFVDHLFIGHFRWGVASLSFAMFCLLVGLALRYDRWWLLLAAGAQLIAVSTHLAGIAGSDALLWSIVSTRMVVWFELLLLALFGVWEARAAPYAHPQSRPAPVRAPHKVTVQ
ncbi:hypothetical protein [Brevundimonas intermedia]|uniref:hypothetical protein n=1 Tax=Brevundimonas intermedia TaxID=74315 RepID=UPI003209ECDB